MPVLGIQNSLNDVYLKQIKEILNEDKNIYRQVFEREKKQVSTMQEQIVPQNVGTVQEMGINIEKTVDLFIKKIEEINNALSILVASSRSGIPIAEKFKDILETYDVIIYYNTFVDSVNNPALPQNAKSIFENKIMQVVPFLQSATHNFKLLLNILTTNELMKPQGVSKSALNLLPQILSAYSLFTLMKQNINDRKYKTIDINDVKDEFSKNIVRDFPTLKEIEIIKQATKQEIQPLIEQRYLQFEEEFGRQPTKKEKDEIAKTFEKNNIYNPMFLDNSRNLLEKYGDERQQIKQILDFATTQSNLEAMEQDEIEDTLEQLREREAELALKEDLTQDEEEELDELNKNITEISYKLNPLKTLKRKQKDLNRLTKISNPSEARKKKMENLEKEINEIVDKLKEQESRLKAKYAEIESKKKRDIQPRTENNPKFFPLEYLGEGKKKKTYIKRKKNPQLEYEEGANETYLY